MASARSGRLTVPPEIKCQDTDQSQRRTGFRVCDRKGRMGFVFGFVEVCCRLDFGTCKTGLNSPRDRTAIRVNLGGSLRS